MAKPSRFWPYIRAIGKVLNVPGTSIGPGFLVEIQDKLSDSENRRELHELLRTIHGETHSLRAELQQADIKADDAGLKSIAADIAKALYCQDVAERLKKADFRGITQMERIVRMNIDDLFVNLKVRRSGSDRWRSFDPESAEEDGEAGASSAGEKNDDDADKKRLAERPAEPYDAILDGPGVTVLLGGPGSGKTTLLKRIARLTALGDSVAPNLRLRLPPGHFPLLVPVSSLVDALDKGGLFESLREHVRTIGGPALEQAFVDHWGAGACLILLDGLDEISHLDARIKASRAIEGCLSDLGRNRVIVSSRIVGYDLCAVSAATQHATVLPFEAKDIETFVHKWHRAFEQGAEAGPRDEAMAQKEAEALLADIRRSPRVQSLASNPLMLTIISLIKHQNVLLPERRVELYDIIVNTLMGSWNMARSLADTGRCSAASTGLKVDEARRVWAEIAFWIHDERNRIVKAGPLRQKLIEVIVALGKDELEATGLAESYLRVATEQSGLLEQTGAEHFAFLHQTFQEFLAAQHLVTQKPRKKAVERILAHADDPRWFEVVRLATGYLGVKLEDGEGASEVISRLIESPDPLEPFVGIGVRLACACVADDVRADQASCDAAAAKLCTLATSERAIATAQYDAAYLLRSMRTFVPGDQAVDALVKLSESQKWQLRMEAARAIARAADRSKVAIGALHALIRDPDKDVAAHAAVGLLSRVDVQERTRLASVIARAAIGPFAHFPVGGPLQAHAVIREMAREPGKNAQLMALDVLGKWGQQAEAVPALLALLKDANSDVRYDVAQTLGGWGLQAAAVPALLALLKDADSDVRYRAAQTLAGWGPQAAALPALLALLKDADSDVRYHAAQALGGWGSQPEALPALLALLKDATLDVRSRAVETLKRWGPQPEALPVLLALLKDGSSDVRSRAAQTLGAWGPQPEALPVLLVLLEDGNLDVRSRAARTLGSWGPQPEALPVLVAMLKDTNLGGRYAATETLRGWGPQSDALPVLVAMLKDTNSSVRSRAAETLAGWGYQAEALPALVAMLKDANSTVRSRAAETLAGWGYQAEALPALVAMLKDANSSVRSQAVETLKSWGGHQIAIEHVMGLLCGDTGVNPQVVAYLVQRSQKKKAQRTPEVSRELARLLACSKHPDSALCVDILASWVWKAVGGNIGNPEAAG